MNHKNVPQGLGASAPTSANHLSLSLSLTVVCCGGCSSTAPATVQANDIARALHSLPIQSIQGPKQDIIEW